jgi:hypothetical protein
MWPDYETVRLRHEETLRNAQRGRLVAAAASATPDGSADPGRCRSDPGHGTQVVAATDGLRLEEGLMMEPTVPTGVVENVAVLDLLSMRTADELAAIARIQNVAVVLVPESLTGALARIPTSNVASIVPVPDGAGGEDFSAQVTAAVVLAGHGPRLATNPVPLTA